MKDKKAANQERAMQFAAQLQARSGMSWKSLEEAVGIDSSNPGETLRNWSNGRSKLVSMRYLQGRANEANRKGLMPPMREGLLRRNDIFGALDMSVNAEKAWLKEEKRLQGLEKTHASAVAAFKELARQLSQDDLMVAVDADGNEIHASDLQAMIEKLRSITLHKIGH